MVDAAPASLDTAALSHRLAELAGEERCSQVEFLLHLDVFDKRRAWAEAGYPSLWEWCVRALHLSEGAAGRRIAAMRVLRRFPGLAEPLRDGRLSLSTAAALGPVLTPANWAELVGRAAFKTKAETEQFVASLQPRQAPREGLRRSSRPRCGGRSGSATAGAAPGARRTGAAAGAPGCWSSTTSSPWRSAGAAPPTT